MIRTTARLPLVAIFCLSLFVVPVAYASSNGIAGYSGKSGSTCTQCHSTGTKPTVTLSGPTSVASGSTNTFTFTVKGAAGNGGLDVAATAGTFTAGTGTKVQSGELVHSSPNTAQTWTFTWTAPTVTANTTATLYAAGIDGYSGGTGTTQVPITVTASTVKPNISVSPATLSFSATAGGAVPGAQTFAVTSSGAAVSYTVAASGGTWLSATGSGSTPGNVSVSVNPAGLAAGTYTGSVTVTSTGAANSPQTVSVTLTVAASSITASPASLSFVYTVGASTPAAQAIALSSSGSALPYTVAASGGTWLSASGSGTTPGNATISVNPAGLAAGSYSGTVTITASGASNSPMSVPVTLTVSSLPALVLSPTSLSFAYTTGGTAPASKTFSVASSGAALTYAVAASGGTWLSAAGSGTTPGTVTVSVNPAGLAAGTYNGTVSITASGAGNSPQSVAVSLTVTTPPSLSVSPTSLTFSYTTGGSAPATQSFAVSSSGSALTFAASSGTGWLSVSGGGATPGSVIVGVNPGTLAAGTYSGMVQVTATGAANSPQTVSVTLVVVNPPDTTPPTVSIITPQPYSVVSGALQLSATASDNVGVVGVRYELDGVQLGTEQGTAPYPVSWDTSTAADGVHVITAIARDAAGNTAATNVNVQVNNSQVQSGELMGVVLDTSTKFQVQQNGISTLIACATCWFGAPADLMAGQALEVRLRANTSPDTADTVILKQQTIDGTIAQVGTNQFTLKPSAPYLPASVVVITGAATNFNGLSPQTGQSVSARGILLKNSSSGGPTLIAVAVELQP
ncbi:MAG: hypothetical protein JO041_02835 [Acidobacteria bacterium]|nr:hypothetical protein [Acidobacteriota bacterium]